jgi:hypothetical protein
MLSSAPPAAALESGCIAMPQRRFTWVLLGVAVLFLSGGLQPTRAQSESSRRLSVEFEIMLGNVRWMLAPTTEPLERKGLHARLASALSYLGITARRYLDERGIVNTGLLQQVHTLRVEFKAGDSTALEARLQDLTKAYPIDLRGILPLIVTPGRLRVGRRLYRKDCWGCHVYPGIGREYPAPDLFRTARTEPRREFAARLIGGVYGNFYTSMENPFSDEQIASLFAYFVHDKPPATK